MKKVFVLLFLCFFFVSISNAGSEALTYLGGRYEDRSQWEILSQDERVIVFMDKGKISFLKNLDGTIDEQIILTKEDFYYVDGVIKKQVQSELAQKGYYIDYLDLDYEVQKVFYDLNKNETVVLWRTIYDKNNEKVYESKFPLKGSYVTYLNDLEQLLKFRKIKSYLAANYHKLLFNTNL